jgi:hypothetical protein
LFEHARPFHAVAAPALALKVSSAGSGVSRWPTAFAPPGTLWQSAQATAACHVEFMVRCAAWAPTPRAVVAVLPWVSRGGSERPAAPWHESHAVPPVTSTLPSMWRVGSVITLGFPAVIVSWHEPQSGFCGCGAAGGSPWHEPHCACEPSTSVHTGVRAVPPVIVAPWQYALVQRALARSHTAAPASVPNVSSAGAGVSMCPTATVAVGTRWHAAQSTCLCHVDGSTWRRCAPTPISVVAVPWLRSPGGAALPPEPWQVSHGWPLLTWTVPSMCCAGIAMTMPAPGCIVG